MVSSSINRCAKILSGLWILPFFLYGCGDDRLPIETIEQSLRTAPSYLITLEDMQERGNFFKSYFHRYRIFQRDRSRITEWLEVPRTYYNAKESLLGMVISGKKEGESISAAPLAYQYVGNTRYGRWRNNNRGQSFWEFDRGAPLFEELDIDARFPIYKKDYKTYLRSKARKIPFFGVKKEYGTYGKITKKRKPDFFQRGMVRKQTKERSFKDKVGKRFRTSAQTTSVKTGRTRTGYRGRSGSRGK